MTLAATGHHTGVLLKQAWFRALLYLAFLPLFPEYFAPVLVVAALVASLRDKKQAERRWSIGTAGKTILLFIAFFAVTTPFAANPLMSGVSTLLWVLMFAVYLSLFGVLTDRGRWYHFLHLITAAAGVVGWIGCVQYLLRFVGLNTPIQAWLWLDRLVYGLLPLNITFSIDGVRVCSTFNNPNLLSQYLVMILPFVCYYAFHAPNPAAQRGGRICLLGVIGAAAFTFSRGAYLAMGLIAFVLIIAHWHNLVTILLSLLATVLLVPDTVWNRLLSLTNLGVDISGLERMETWDICLELIAKEPFWGSGCGIFHTWEVLAAHNVSAPHAHNTVFQLLVEGGLVALCLFLFLGFHVAQCAFALVGKRGNRQFGATILAFIVGFGAQSLVEYPFTFPILVCTFGVVISLVDIANTLETGSPSVLPRKRRKDLV